MWEIFLGISLSFSKFPWWKSVKAENQWINGIAFQNWRGKNYVSEQQRIWGPSLQTYSANFCNNSCRILILSYSRFYNSDSELFSTENLWEFKKAFPFLLLWLLLNAFLLFFCWGVKMMVIGWNCIGRVPPIEEALKTLVLQLVQYKFCLGWWRSRHHRCRHSRLRWIRIFRASIRKDRTSKQLESYWLFMNCNWNLSNKLNYYSVWKITKKVAFNIGQILIKMPFLASFLKT